VIRLAILDDNPFVRDPRDDTIRPASATFHTFAEAVVAAGPFGRADYLVPVADGHDRPALPQLGNPVDVGLLRVVATAPFEGISGYLRSSPGLVRRNWPIIRATIGSADLVWIKAPASNAALAALACRRARVARFTWVAGSVRDVVRGQRRSGAGRVAAEAIATAYDATTRWLERTGPSIRLDGELFSSIVTTAEVEVSETVARGRPVRPASDGTDLVWAGRLAGEKGIDDLLVAVSRLRSSGLDARLDLLGDGPERVRLEALAASLGLNGAIRFRGHIADRAAYLEALRAADLFVMPSRAEGVPKAVVEAMGAGVPVVASRVGGVPALLGDGDRGVLVGPGGSAALAAAIAGLASDQAARERLRWTGLAFAADHTASAQAARLVAWMRRSFPDLAWPVEAGS
jgi:glycosyltransferase involved in cell wall biosynthesis